MLPELNLQFLQRFRLKIFPSRAELLDYLGVFAPSEHGRLVEVVRECLNEAEELPDGNVGVLVLGLPARVEGLVSEVGGGLLQGSQLQQVNKVEIFQPERALAVGLVRVEPLVENLNVGPPNLLGPEERGRAHLVQRIVCREVDGDAGVKAGHGSEESSLLQTQSLHGLRPECRTEAGFVAGAGGAHRTEAVLLVYRPPDPPAGLPTVAREPLRVEGEVDMDAVLAVARVQLAEITGGRVVVPRPGSEIVRSCLGDRGVHLVLVVLLLLISNGGLAVLVGLLAVFVV